MHNLRNVYVEIPRNSLTVVTGVSGSGKSSLAFDTIFAEGQRRYVESLSAYARQFLNHAAKTVPHFPKRGFRFHILSGRTAGLCPGCRDLSDPVAKADKDNVLCLPFACP